MFNRALILVLGLFFAFGSFAGDRQLFSREQCVSVRLAKALSWISINPANDPRLADRSGRTLVSSLAGKVNSLIKKMGYRDFQAYSEDLAAHQKTFPATYSMIHNNQVEFSIQADEAHRIEIATGGFRHTFETGYSYVEEKQYAQDRDMIEANFAQIRPLPYTRAEPDLKPKYGLARPPLGSSLKPYFAGQYGSDIWILDKNVLQGRVTFSMGDSLNQVSGPGGMLKILVSRALKISPRFRATAWFSKVFIPWEMRDLMIPVAERTAEKENILGLGPFFLGKKGKEKAIRGAEKMYGPTNPLRHETINDLQQGGLADHLPLKNYTYENSRATADYIELQYWGGMDNPSVLRELIFTRNPPTPDEMKVLQARRITVFDGRNRDSSPVPYLP